MDAATERVAAASLVHARYVSASLWRWTGWTGWTDRRVCRCWAAEGILKSLARALLLFDTGILAEMLAVGLCPTALRISAHLIPTRATHHFPSRARPPGGNGASWGEVWLCCRDVKKTCALPIARPVQSNYSCWRPNARRHGLRERECLVLVGRDHCTATWMKGIFFS